MKRQMQTNFMDLDVLEELKLQEEIKNNKKLRIARMVIILVMIAFVVFIVPRILGILPPSQFWAYFFLIIAVTGVTAAGYVQDWPSSPFNTVYKDLQTKIFEWNNVLTTHKDLMDVQVVSNTIKISYFDDNGILQTKTFAVHNVYTYDKDVLLVKGYSANGTYRIDCYKPYK